MLFTHLSPPVAAAPATSDTNEHPCGSHIPTLSWVSCTYSVTPEASGVSPWVSSTVYESTGLRLPDSQQMSAASSQLRISLTFTMGGEGAARGRKGDQNSRCVHFQARAITATAYLCPQQLRCPCPTSGHLALASPSSSRLMQQLMAQMVGFLLPTWGTWAEDF